MILNGAMALTLRYFTQLGSFRAHCVKLVEDVVVKMFTFAISSHDEFPVTIYIHNSTSSFTSISHNNTSNISNSNSNYCLFEPTIRSPQIRRVS